jgi:YesN/AraC family two-component response regulator
MNNMHKLFHLGKEMKILYVEDDNALREHTKSLLNDFFSDIKVAACGQSGLALYQEDSDGFDIVITDLNMPNMDGIAMVKKIIEIKVDQAVVVMTAHSESEYLKELIELGVESFALKPVNLLQLITALSSTAQLVSLRRENAKLKDMLRKIA